MAELVVHHTLTVDGANLLAADFDAGGRLLVGGELVNAVLVYDPESGILARRIPFKGSASSLAVSPDGARLAVGGRQGAVIDLGADRRLADFKSKMVQSHAFAWSRDGSRLARADGNQVLLHDASGALLKKHALPKQRVSGEAVPALVGGLRWRDEATVVALATYTRDSTGPSETDWERKYTFAACSVSGALDLRPLHDGYATLRAVPGAPLGIVAVVPSAMGSLAARPTTLELVDLATFETRKQAVAAPPPLYLTGALSEDTALVSWRDDQHRYQHGTFDLRDGHLGRVDGSDSMTMTVARRSDGLLAFIGGQTIVIGRLDP